MALGMVEVTRSLLVKEVLDNASYKGCVTGTVPPAACEDYGGCQGCAERQQYQSRQCDNHDSGQRLAVTDAKLAIKNDKLSVMVSIPYSAVTWMKTYMFIPSETLQSETVVMLRSS